MNYGFTAETYGEELNVYLPTGVKIAGKGEPISIKSKDSGIVVKLELLRREIKVKYEKSKYLPSLVYYAWLEQSRKDYSKLISSLIQAATKSKPRPECIKMFQDKFSVNIDRRGCVRFFAALSYLLAVSMIIENKEVSLIDLTEPSIYFPKQDLDPVRSAQLTALRSLFRSLIGTVEKPEHIIEISNSIKQRFKNTLLFLKSGYILGSYFERLEVPIASYIPGISVMAKGFRHIYPSRSNTLIEAGIIGEALWQQTGDGTISCRPKSPLSTALSLMYTEGLGPRLVVPQTSEAGMKCVSLYTAECDSSLVLNPTDSFLDKILSSWGIEGGLELYYYRESLLAVKTAFRTIDKIRIYRVIDDIGSSLLRSILALDSMRVEDIRINSQNIGLQNIRRYDKFRKYFRIIEESRLPLSPNFSE